MDEVRGWVDRAWTVGGTAQGPRVLTTVKRAAEDGRSWTHQVVEHTGTHPPTARTPEGHNCLDPVLLTDGTLLLRTDRGQAGGPLQLAERSPSGDWRVWTDAPGGVVAFVAAGDTVVVLEQHPASAAPWTAEVAVVQTGPARFWQNWQTESTHRLVRIDRRSGTRTCLATATDRTLSRCLLALSPDGAWLACTPQRVAEDGILQRGFEIWSLRTGTCIHRLWGPANTDHSAPVFSPDSRRLAGVQHTRPPDGHGRRQLISIDLATGQRTALCPRWSGWLEPQSWTEDHGLLCLATENARVGVFRVQPGAPHPTRIDTGTWSWEQLLVGDRVWGIGSRLHVPPALLPIDDHGPASVTAPWSAPPPCPTLFWPASEPGPRPLVLMVHGGPVSAWSDAWHPRQPAAFFHRMGFHVLLPNPVGSIGHGDAHVEAIWHHWDRCTVQLQQLLQQARDRADVSALFVFGGSFGGWAVNRLATLPDGPPLAGVITHAGIFDHHTMKASCDEPDLFVWHLGLGETALHRSDPARSVDHWQAPTLILHGALDFCVPVEQAVALHHALEDRSVPHRLVVFPGEGHHILQPHAGVRWWQEVARFCRDH